jgi:hypothetical protein
MIQRRFLVLLTSWLLLSGLVSGCHFAGHVSPGQVKKVVAPSPGHVGIPPGQLKKY